MTAFQHPANTGSYGVVTVGLTATEIVPGNPARRSVLILNADANDIAVGLDSSVQLGTGFTVDATGGSLKIDDYTGPVFGISATASSNVRFLEIG